MSIKQHNKESTGCIFHYQSSTALCHIYRPKEKNWSNSDDDMTGVLYIAKGIVTSPPQQIAVHVTLRLDTTTAKETQHFK